MPFISSIRRNFKKTDSVKKESILDHFDITGGDVVYTAGGYRIHCFLQTGDSSFTVTPKHSQATQLLGSSLLTEFLVIGGGGSGGEYGGAGGAGGYIEGKVFLPIASYPVTVGDGGAHPGSGSYSSNGNNGQNSVFGSYTALGGGYGGTWQSPAFRGGSPGGAGGGCVGHGGGGGGGAGGRGGFASGAPDSPGTQQEFGQGTNGQGWPGGRGYASPSNGGPGGPGLTSSITGTAVTRAGGGGGNGHNATAGTGGPGGGGPGNGGPGPANTVLSGIAGSGTFGTTNTGGGSGGAQDPATANHSKGGSGIVVVRYQV